MNHAIEVSVVLPCLNEEKSIGSCIESIKAVFARCDIRGEIVVADNGSVDSSRAIAQSAGARVVVEPHKGYGLAYQCGLRHAQGAYIVIGDSDNTYDFNDIPKFLDLLKAGSDFVIGSRFKGTIKKGAMPWTHRYIGNPILSGICRLFFHTKLSDIHCGMRAFTMDAYKKMRLMTPGMEFATEMVVSALNNNLRVSEVAIDYLPRAGKSKLSPLYDAWRHMRFMLIFCPVWLYFIPGISGLVVGLGILLILLRGPVLFLGHSWDLHLMVFASVISILSYQVLQLGIYAHTVAIRQGFLKYDKATYFFKMHFSLERGLLLGGLIFLSGLVIMAYIFVEWYSSNFGALSRLRESILAMTLLVVGLQTMFSSFFISFLFLERQ